MAPDARFARVAVAPVLPSASGLAAFGLVIDRVRFVVVRPLASPDTLADTTVDLPPELNELTLDLRVLVVTNPESLSVSVVVLGGTVPLFTGTRLVQVPTPLPPPEIPVDQYIGPVVDSVLIQPRVPFILLNDSLRFQVQGFHLGAPVSQFFVAWSSSDTTLAKISSLGVLRAPAARSFVWVRASTPSGGADSVRAIFTLAATQLVLVSGGVQTDTVGQVLNLPLEVQARAADGLGVGGVAVRFRGVLGGGTVADSIVVTDTAGRARTTATLGGLLGGQTFEASATGLTGSPVLFTANALAGPPAQMLAVAGDALLATVGSLLPTSPTVRIGDAGGNAIAGVGVTFAVASGGGSLTGGTQVTDANGVATLGGWTLGTLAGVNTVTATAAGLTRTFTATGLAGAATQLLANAGDLQSAVVGTIIPTAPAVRAVDQFGNSVAGAAITFAVTAGSGLVTGATQLTNATGIATVGGWKLGTLAGANTLAATLGAITPVVFRATGLAGAATQIVKVTGDLQSAVVNTLVPVAPQVRILDQFGNPVSGVVVNSLVSSGGGSVTTPATASDTAGIASVAGWRLGTLVGPNALSVGATGLAGTPISFTATGLVGAASQLTAFAGDGQSALVGSAVSINPVARVSDQYGNAIGGVPVTFTISLGGGNLGTPSTITTDTAGIARSPTWTLGLVAGLNTLTATAASLPAVTFSADGFASLASTIALQGGDGQVGNVATPLATAYSVIVKNLAGAPVAGVPVSWAVASGGGSIAPASSTTDGAGVATAVRTLGTSAGTQTATASVGGLSGSPVVFTATAQAGAAARLVKTSLDPQSGTVGQLVSSPPTIRAEDQYGNRVSGVIVTFTVTSGGGGVTATADTGDAQGVTSVGWSLGTVAGTNALRASATGVPAVTFSASGLAGAPTQLAFVPQPSHALAGNPISPSVRVAFEDQYGNIVPGVSDVVDLGLAAQPNPAAKLIGVTSVAAIGGIATFDVGIDSAGVGYILSATTPKIPAGATSAPFDIGGVLGALLVDRLGPVAAALDPSINRLYVPGATGVAVLDADKLQLLTQIQPITAPFGVAVDSITHMVYVSTAAGVVVIDGTKNSVVTTIPLFGAKGIAVDEEAHRVYVAVTIDGVQGPPGLASIDGVQNKLDLTIPLGAGSGVGVAFNPNDRLVYIAMGTAGVAIVDPAGAKIVGLIDLAGAKGTYGLGLDVQTNLLYATNQDENSLSVIDLTGRKELTRLAVGRVPQGVGVDATRRVVYVGNSGEATVSFIDASKFNVAGTLTVGPTPKAAVVQPATGRVFVPTFTDDQVRVVQP